MPRIKPRTLLVDDEITLEPIRMEHAESIFALVDASRAHLQPWLSWLENTRSVDDTRRFIADAIDKLASDDGLQFCICSRKEVAGVIGLNHVDWENKVTSVGYWIARSYEGRGMATRSVAGLIEFIFEDLALNRVQIEVAITNHRSHAVARRLRFQPEGQLREAIRLGEGFVDAKLYSLLRRDWSTKRI